MLLTGQETHKTLERAVAKLVVMLVMLSMTKNFLKMYVFILFFNSDFFYISDIVMHVFSDFRVFPVATVLPALFSQPKSGKLLHE